jgi:hypothetical protein
VSRSGSPFSLAVLFVEPIVDELGQSHPPLAGWPVAVASAGILLILGRRHRRCTRPRLDAQVGPGDRFRLSTATNGRPRTAIINMTSREVGLSARSIAALAAPFQLQLSEWAGPHLTAFNIHLNRTFGRGRNGASGAS